MKFLRVISAIFREIFDESAYERFRAREGCVVSTDSYRRFLKNKDQRKQPRIKCC